MKPMDREVDELEAELAKRAQEVARLVSNGQLPDPDQLLQGPGAEDFASKLANALGNAAREEPIRVQVVGLYARQLVYVDQRAGLGVPMFVITSVACRLAGVWMARQRATRWPG